MTPAPYDRQFTIQVTGQTLHFIDQLAERQNTSRAEVVRQALREYLEAQEDAIGSRSRQSRRVLARLEELEAKFSEQQAHAHTCLLAAAILLRMKEGDRGVDVLDQIGQLVTHAGGEIREVLAAKK